MAAYATPADLTARYDIEVIAQLAPDDRTPISRADVSTHPNVLKGGLSVSGEVEAALRRAKLYSVDQLNNLEENSGEYFKTIVCCLWMAWLFKRRPGVNVKQAEDIKAEADAYMKRIATGEDILGINNDTSHEDAGLPSLEGPTVQQVESRNFLSAKLSRRYLIPVEERTPGNRGGSTGGASP